MIDRDATWVAEAARAPLAGDAAGPGPRARWSTRASSTRATCSWASRARAPTAARSRREALRAGAWGVLWGRTGPSELGWRRAEAL